ncbi:MAG: hypothetical protein HQM02_06005 [Magnetococcales bacterium]|nr:hypothetical protein [Magnetococcales bacterium]
MSRSESDDAEHQRRLLELVERAEGLAFSEEWRTTPRVMRQLLKEWQALEALRAAEEPEWITRFRAARQTFMERRAEYYLQGNLRKGADLMRKLEATEAGIIALKQDLQAHYETLHNCESRLQATPVTRRESAVQRFIRDSIVSLKEEIRQKEAALGRLESSVNSISSRYYCVE